MSREMILSITETIRARYLAHEMSADDYAVAMEDIALVSRKRGYNG